jgi:hypothetical protein
VNRRGSALVLVLVMTLSMAGLAISAVLLTSSAAFVQRFYDKEKDFRFLARAGIALTKAQVQRDTTLSIPFDTAYRAFTAATVADAGGTAIPLMKYNAYAAFTGDTAGTYIPFLTIMAQAYDTMGTRSVQRLDLSAESFSRYQLFVDSFPSTVAIAVGQHLRGRVHGNRNWVSSSTSPGPNYYDTVSAVGSVSGTASYNGITAVTSAKRIKWPTTATLSNLATLGTAGNLSVAPQLASASRSMSSSIGIDESGQLGTSSTVQAGTSVRLRPVDVNNNGSLDAAEGFFEVFNLAAGIDTGSLRADLPRSSGSATHIVTMNQCGLLVTISGRREFFPVSRFRESWVRSRIQTSTAPVISSADATTMSGSSGGVNALPTSAAVNKILSYGVGYSRCYPAGSPYLMLSERHVQTTGDCIVTTSTSTRPYGWAADGASCSSSKEYGGQDTTFTATVTRCVITGTNGRCDENQDALGSWQVFPGTSTASPPASVLQSSETAYLWPISSTYNAASRGIAYFSNTNPVYLSGTLRGFLTAYSLGRVVLVDDLMYDEDPTGSGNLCRNLLGLIAGTGVSVADNATNRPRPDPGGTYRFLGTPNYTLHGIVMALTNSVGVEAPSGAQVTSPAIACSGTNTSGGCLNLTGGAITKIYAVTTTASGTGFIENRTVDPCQAQQTNRRPPHFPLTGRYADYKWYDIDSRGADTWGEVKTYLSRLRGNNRPVP